MPQSAATSNGHQSEFTQEDAQAVYDLAAGDSPLSASVRHALQVIDDALSNYTCACSLAACTQADTLLQELRDSSLLQRRQGLHRLASSHLCRHDSKSAFDLQQPECHLRPLRLAFSSSRRIHRTLLRLLQFIAAYDHFGYAISFNDVPEQVTAESQSCHRRHSTE